MSVPDNYLEVTPEQLVRFRELQTPEEAAHDEGFDAGEGLVPWLRGLVHPYREAYQFGQAARRESDEEQ